MKMLTFYDNSVLFIFIFDSCFTILQVSQKRQQIMLFSFLFILQYFFMNLLQIAICSHIK